LEPNNSNKDQLIRIANQIQGCRRERRGRPDQRLLWNMPTINRGRPVLIPAAAEADKAAKTPSIFIKDGSGGFI
jgi:hypothetical protein